MRLRPSSRQKSQEQPDKCDRQANSICYYRLRPLVRDLLAGLVREIILLGHYEGGSIPVVWRCFRVLPASASSQGNISTAMTKGKKRREDRYKRTETFRGRSYNLCGSTLRGKLCPQLIEHATHPADGKYSIRYIARTCALSKARFDWRRLVCRVCHRPASSFQSTSSVLYGLAQGVALTLVHFGHHPGHLCRPIDHPPSTC